MIMTQKEKLNYMRIAMSICNFGFQDKDLDLFVSLYDLVNDKKGLTDLKDILEVQNQVNERHKTPKKEI